MATKAQTAKAKRLKIELAKGKIKFRTRVFNRCLVSGRPRGYIRRFGLAKNVFRKLALKGLLPGVVKASW